MRPTRPDFIAHWTEIEEPDGSSFEGDDELLSIGSPLGSRLGSAVKLMRTRLSSGRCAGRQPAPSARHSVARPPFCGLGGAVGQRAINHPTLSSGARPRPGARAPAGA
jgi:hypothetical protein